MCRLSRVSTVVAILCGLLANACNSSSTTSNAVAPTPARCVPALSGAPQIVQSGGGAGTVALTINRECTWTAKPEVEWISVSPATGQGESQISFSVASNPQPTERKGAIVINEQRFEVTQRAACVFTLSPTQATAEAGGAKLQVTVTAAAGCAWQAVSQVSWITVSAGASGDGPGSVTLDVSANGGTDSRTGDVLIAGVRFSVRQSGSTPAPPPPPAPPNCQVSLSASSAEIGSAGGTESVDVIAPDECEWTAQSSDAWLTVNSGSSGRGGGEVRFTAGPNTSSSPRTATLKIAGIDFRVTQAGASAAPPDCAYSLSSTTESVPAGGGTGAIAVTAPNGCAWTATSSASWLTVTSGSTGSGSGEVRFTASQNTESTPRTATLTIAGIQVSVTQAGAVAAPECTYSLSSTTESVPAAGGSGAITVTAPTGCGWTAISSAPWLTVTAGAIGSGNGTVQYSVEAHTATSPRSASLTIGGQTATVNQAAAAAPVCSFTVSPTTIEAPASGVTGNITVTASASTCSWTASTSASWITLTSASQGTGNATIGFSVAENTSTSSRSGAIDVSGTDVAVSQDGAPPAQPNVEGVVSALQGECPTLTFEVSGRTVRTNSSTKFMGGPCGKVDNGVDVTVEGTVESDNSINAATVRIN